MTGEAAGKTCCKCEIDVSQAKRHKDAKGRYWCEACFAKAAAESKKAGGTPEGKAPAASGGATPAWLAGSMAVEGKRCTACSAAMPKDGVICTSCGHNSETGKAMGTRVVMAPKEKAPKRKRSGSGFDPVMLAYAYGVLGIGLFIGGTMNSACTMGFLIVTGLSTFAVGIWILIAMALQSVLKAVLGFLCGLYALYWVFTQCESQLLRTCVLMNIVIYVLFLLGQGGVVPLVGMDAIGAP